MELSLRQLLCMIEQRVGTGLIALTIFYLADEAIKPCISNIVAEGVGGPFGQDIKVWRIVWVVQLLADLGNQSIGIQRIKHQRSGRRLRFKKPT